jgi:hypothetical protein
MVSLSLTNMILALVAGLFLVFMVLGTGFGRMHWFLLGTLLVYTASENHIYFGWRPLLLQMRWVVLPLFALFFLIRLGRNRAPIRSDGHTAWFLAFAAIAMSTAATSSSNPYISLAKGATLLLLFFAVFLGYRNYLNSYPDGAHATAATYSALGLIVLVGNALIYYVEPMETFRPSFRGFFINPNALAMMILTVTPFFYYQHLNPRGTKRRPVYLVVLVGMAVQLVMTAARASVGGLLVTMAILLLVFNRRYLPLLGALGVLVYGYFFFTGVSDVGGIGESVFVRKYIYKERTDLLGRQRRPIMELTLKNIRENPFLGVGYGISYQWEGNQEQFLKTGYLDKREKGNSYLAIQEETGMVGSLVVLVLLWRLVARGYRTIRLGLRSLPRSDPDLVLLVIYFANVVSLLVNATFENWLFSVGHFLCFMFWINFLAVAKLSDVVTAKLPATAEAAARPEDVEPLPFTLPTPGRSRPVPQPPAPAEAPILVPPRRFTY